MQPAQAASQPLVKGFAVLGGFKAEHRGQPLCNVLQRVGEVAVTVQRFDQHNDCGVVFGRQAHADQLTAQMVLQ